MTEDQEVLVQQDGSLLKVTINRPHRSNSLARSTLQSLLDAFQIHADNNDLKTAILTGAGERSFCAGGDLYDLDKVRSRDDAQMMIDLGTSALSAIREFPVPVIAAINGVALGGGAELALACDIRVATAGAQIGMLQGRMNIPTVWGGGADLCHVVGPSNALRLLVTTELLSARDALDIGLIDLIGRADEHVMQTAAMVINPISRQSPHVLRDHKALVLVARLRNQEALSQTETGRAVESWLHGDHWAASKRALKSGGGIEAPTRGFSVR